MASQRRKRLEGTSLSRGARLIEWTSAAIALAALCGSAIACESDPPRPANSAKLRRLGNDEITSELQERATEALRELANRETGAERSFEHDGKRYVARLETHYRPPGSGAGPTGYHPGVSLFVEGDGSASE